MQRTWSEPTYDGPRGSANVSRKHTNTTMMDAPPLEIERRHGSADKGQARPPFIGDDWIKHRTPRKRDERLP